MFIKWITLVALVLIITQHAKGQDAFKAISHLFTTPKNYMVSHTNQAPKIDGNINDVVWQQAAWTDLFVDIEGDPKPKPNLATRVKMLWNDSSLFVAVKMDEPNLWANLIKHDQIIFNDNDFEIFIDPDNDARDYFEIEVNQRNKIFDLFLPKPYRDKGDALISWDAPGMQSAVQLQGTLNNPTDIDKGWTVEFKIPFNTIKMGFANGTPAEGAIWRINFSRVEWDTRVKKGKYIKLTNAKGKKLPERNWVWSAPGIISMHAPERWGYLKFTKKEHETLPVFKVPYADLQKQYLWLIYYNQQQYYRLHGVYTSSLNDLGISSPEIDIAGTPNVISISSSMYHYSASVGDGKAMVWTISNEGLIRPNQLSAKPKRAGVYHTGSFSSAYLHI